MSEVANSQRLNNSDLAANNLSTHETGGSSPEQVNDAANTQYSHLFPAHLYLNRDLSNLNQSDQQYDIAQKAYIGKDAEQDAYDRMPIEDFGKSVLSKFGWTEGKGVGRLQQQQNKIVQPIEYMPRQHRLGLGAKPLTKDQIKKMGDDYDKRRLTVTEDYQTNNAGDGKNYKSIHSELKKKEKMQIGSKVYIISGNHEGMEGKIVAISESSKNKKNQQQAMGEEVQDEIDGDSYVSVELIINDSIVNIKRKRMILKSDRDRLNQKDTSQEKSLKRSRSRSFSERDKKKKKQKKLKWVIPGIIVRVISKKVADGKLYNKKLKITDVLNDFKFLAIPEGNEEDEKRKDLVVFENLVEKDLETVLPKDNGGNVAVLRGEYKGEIGKMLSRDRKKDQVEIQVGFTEIIKLSQDDCCAVFDQ